MAAEDQGRFGRRAFLRATGVGGAALGIAAASPGWLAGAQATTSGRPAQARSESPGTPPSGAAPGQPIVALVRDASKGEIVVFWGEQEIVVTDADLATRLSQASTL